MCCMQYDRLFQQQLPWVSCLFLYAQFLLSENVCLATNFILLLTQIQIYSQFQVGGGGHFEIQYGGHRGQIFGGPISENICTILVNICAKFGAFIIKCTIWSNIGA